LILEVSLERGKGDLEKKLQNKLVAGQGETVFPVVGGGGTNPGERKKGGKGKVGAM